MTTPDANDYLPASGPLLSLDPPPEPPVGSVCVDRFGRAWQRRRHGMLAGTVWCPVLSPDETRAPVSAGVSWVVLLGESGPALSVYETTEDHDPATAEHAERNARIAAAVNAAVPPAAPTPAEVVHATPDDCPLPTPDPRGRGTGHECPCGRRFTAVKVSADGENFGLAWAETSSLQVSS